MRWKRLGPLTILLQHMATQRLLHQMLIKTIYKSRLWSSLNTHYNQTITVVFGYRICSLRTTTCYKLRTSYHIISCKPYAFMPTWSNGPPRDIFFPLFRTIQVSLVNHNLAPVCTNTNAFSHCSAATKHKQFAWKTTISESPFSACATLGSVSARWLHGF